MHKQLLMRSGFATLPPPQKRDRNLQHDGKQTDFSPLPWHSYFDKKEFVELHNRGTFNVYSKGNSGPLLYLIHGAGMSALSWAVFSSSFLTLNEVYCVACDIRGHGETVTSNDNDLSLETLVEDAEQVLLKIVQARSSIDAPVIVIGHSLGGSIAVNLALRESLENTIKAVIVIDVVEGSTLSALSGMQQFLRNRPPSFKNIKDAIEHLYRSNQIRNVESVRVSGVANFKEVKGAFCKSVSCISEEEEFDNSTSSSDNTCQQSYITWRVNLKDSEPYWDGWFRGMSSKFLKMKCPKLLLLADVSRLDKELTLAQMQGKFQVQVIKNCGHVIHEDLPDIVASNVNIFLIRYKLLQ